MMESNKRRIRKKPFTENIFIPMRVEHLGSTDGEHGMCLLCEEWIGVNSDHDHSHVSPEAPPQHNRYDGVPQTPHIIVSPEVGDNEPFFGSPEDAMNEIKNESKEEPSPSTSQDTPKPSDEISMPKSQTDKVLNGAPANDISPPISQSSTGTTGDAHQKDSPRRHSEPKKAQAFRNYSEDSSSSENSPVDDRGPYFSSHDIPVGASAPVDYIRPPGQHQRLENNLASGMASASTHSIRSLPPSLQSPFRSISMASLDPADHYTRKSRKNSMIGMMRRVSSQSNLGLPNLPPQIGRSNSRVSLMTNPVDWKEEMNESLILCVSALYAKLLVVMGMAFPIAETISKDVPLFFYNSFYLYLYFGSILFLIYAYLFLLRAKPFTTAARPIQRGVESLRTRISKVDVNWRGMPMPNSVRNIIPKKKEPDPKSEKAEKLSVSPSTYKPPKYTLTESNNHGSMYLKMGAVIFGIGSMIYSGLEFGQYFEYRSDPACANMLMAITPVGRMIFTFLQMYFIFLNSRVAISKHTIIARFGLMHMIGTNLCIWLNVLVQETKHEIEHLTSREDHFPFTNGIPNVSHHQEHGNDSHHGVSNSSNAHHVGRRSAGSHHDGSCKELNLMGHVVNSASPFLFPCTIEYSLLCAGVLYVMWKNINVNRSERNAMDGDSDISTFIAARKVRHHYSVDCARASRGLFMGIFILVLTIISLILFYVLISNEQFKTFAILEANIIEVSIYSLAIISVIVGMKQMRELEFILEGDIELDNILLIIAQAGVYIYTSFTIIGGYFSLEEIKTLPLVTAILTLIQTTLQTLFILDGSRRCCYTEDQLDRKPGREMVTFLLVCNLAMWAISTFETSRADVHPTQLQFYGIWAWTIISHVSMPLAIFYRFHVTVCLGEIWKRAYKPKHDLMGL